MPRRLLILLVMLAAAAVVAILAVGLSALKPQPDDAPASASAAAPTPATGPTQVSEAGGVQVRATFDPRSDLSEDRLTFTISLDTHSVDLGQFDLSNQIRVILEPGGVLTDLSWQAEGGGHHVGGKLMARAPASALATARSIRLELSGLAAEEPRKFEWRLGSK